MFPWGNEITCSLAQYKDCPSKSLSVGSLPDGASPYGALDMAGNVWEWVNDWYDLGYYSRSPEENPTGPLDGEYRVIRGGSWGFEPWYVRSTYRLRDHPYDSVNETGFRCALTS
jgi:formylglycine-generating enzyme required for sulfatase activity